MERLFALADCNNFYVSCERVFQPKLAHQPVLVLSNNDGCVIARSQEVKRLRVPMGAPIHQYHALVEQHHIQVFSANFSLYGQMSARVMHVLGQFSGEVEVYSIDEAFLGLMAATAEDNYTFGRRMRQLVGQWTGIPLSVGIARTKTLAKIANAVAKKYVPDGVFVFHAEQQVDDVLRRLDVQDVWGIGGRHAAFLRSTGIRTALDLKHAPDQWVRTHLHVTGLRTVYELRGLSCLPLELVPSPKQQVMCSRSFGRVVHTKDELKEAVATYAARVGEKLRQEHQVASTLGVCIETNPFQVAQPQYCQSCIVSLPAPLNHTPDLIRAAHRGMERMFRPGYEYHKAGVYALDLGPEGTYQMDFITPTAVRTAHGATMQALDAINAKFGRDTVKLGATGLAKGWQMRQEHRSPKYLTRREDFPIAGG